MKLFYRLFLLVGACAFISAAAHGQGVFDKTTLGQRQNDDRDLANSLVPGEKKYGGKGEKKAQVNASELKSKSIKDTTFGGTLLNMGIDPAQPKLDEQKLHSAPTEKESTGSKEAESKQKEPELLQLADPALTLSESNPSNAGAVVKESKTSSAAASDTATGNAEKKDQKPASAKSEEKPTDKAAKSDGDR
jgi:hypothetical protein